MDWNPFKSSLFTGAGTPWGAMETGMPDKPAYANDPMAFQGFDSSSLRDALNQQLRRGASQRRAGSLAAAQKGGALSSGQTIAGLGDISAQQAEQENLMNAQLARQDWMDRVAAMNQYNDRIANQYAIDRGAYDQERAGRGRFWGDLFKAGTSLATAKLLGPLK